MSSNHRFDDQLATYALGALAEQDRKELEAHLRECARCRAQVQEARAVVNLLSRTVEPISPNPETRRKLMARIEADLAESPAPAVHPVPVRVSPLPTWLLPTLAIGLLIVLAISLSREWFIASLIGVLMGVMLWVLVQSSRQPARTTQRMVATWSAAVALAVIVGVVGAPFVTSFNQDRQVAAILNNPNAQTRPIAGTSDAPGAQGQLIAVPEDTHAVLKVSGLKPLAPDKIYEFWLIHGSTPTPAGLFNVDATGNLTLLVSATQPIDQFDKLGVTIEPHAGVPKPSGTLVMQSGLQ